MQIILTPISTDALSQMGNALKNKVVLIQKNPDDQQLSYAMILAFLPQTGEVSLVKGSEKMATKIHYIDKFAVIFDNGCGGPISLNQVKAITAFDVEHFLKVVRLAKEDPSLCEINPKPFSGIEFPSSGWGC
ncbi:MAG: hypothetical protein UT37_C0013G0005 [Parcubacteria group bacterium GW2011_GWA2_39_18]|nr:MAG: hypothetical protein UT37_C0013G0005 [Parcubacteria group bacterium GW2011_GWA2_39_18]